MIALAIGCATPQSKFVRGMSDARTELSEPDKVVNPYVYGVIVGLTEFIEEAYDKQREDRQRVQIEEMIRQAREDRIN